MILIFYFLSKHIDLFSKSKVFTNYIEYEVSGDKHENIRHFVHDIQCRGQFHSRIEIMYVLKGHKKVIINDNEKTLCEDNIALSMSFDVHRYMKSSDSIQLLLTLPVGLFFNYYEQYGRLSLKDHFITDSNQAKILKPLFYKIIENKNDTYVASGYCTALLGSLTRILGTVEATENMGQQWLKDVLHYIEDNYREDLTITDLAKRFGFSKNYMSQLFNAKVGAGFRDYINIVRLKHAVAEMKKGKSNITDICFKHGFGSISTFYRCFREHYRTSPKSTFLDTHVEKRQKNDGV